MYHRNALEDPWNEPSESMFTRSVSPEQAPDEPTYVEIEFERGDPIAIDGYRLSPATLLTRLNELAGANGERVENPVSVLRSKSLVEDYTDVNLWKDDAHTCSESGSSVRVIRLPCSSHGG